MPGRLIIQRSHTWLTFTAVNTRQGEAHLGHVRWRLHWSPAQFERVPHSTVNPSLD
jgi:hypothetical protein